MLLINNDCNKIECRKGIPVFRNNNSHISIVSACDFAAH